jgi:hypothetical protein
VTAHNGSTAAAIINYADFISACTKVLAVPPGHRLGDDPPHAASERLILERKDAPSGIKPDVFPASGPVPGEPDGYLVKVGAEVPAPPGEMEFGVAPATLPEVFEKAEIGVSSDVATTSRPLPFTDKIQCGAGTGWSCRSMSTLSIESSPSTPSGITRADAPGGCGCESSSQLVRNRASAGAGSWTRVSRVRSGAPRTRS